MKIFLTKTKILKNYTNSMFSFTIMTYFSINLKTQKLYEGNSKNIENHIIDDKDKFSLNKINISFEKIYSHEQNSNFVSNEQNIQKNYSLSILEEKNKNIPYLLNSKKIYLNNFYKNSFSTFCVLKKNDIINHKKIDKIKDKFNRDSSYNSKLTLIQKNIISELDSNVSPDIKKEIDSTIKIFSELEKEPTPVSKIDAYYYMKSVDSTFESFFHNREFNLKNFNYYMQVLSSQYKNKEMEEIIEKMSDMGIHPNSSTYVILMGVYAKLKDIKECERIFSIIKKRTNKVNIYTYNTLLLCYAKNGLINESEAIINEMKTKGLNPDTACYTTLIHAYKKCGKIYKCWEIYETCMYEGKTDEFLISYMIKLAGITHEPERALQLYEYFELQGYNHYTINFNSLIYALSSKKTYSEKALEMFKKMKARNVMPDSYTYVCVLRAAANLGDINTANEVLKEMKIMNIPINQYICNGLIRTYSGAAKIPYVKLEHLEEYLKDSWNIISFMEKNNIDISVNILDSLLEVHCIMHKIEDVDGLILPLYERYGYQYTVYTYEKLVQMLFDLRIFDRVIKIYNDLNKKKETSLLLSDNILNYVIETGLRTNDCDLIVSSLENYAYINRTPKKQMLKNLASMENMPDSLYVELKNWTDFNKMGRKMRAFSPPQIRERSRTLPAVFRKKGKRIK